MKSIKKVSVSLAASAILLISHVHAQGIVSDSVSIQSSYTNQTFYSLSNGTVSSVSNTDWDLAFQLKGYAGSILINSKNGIHVWDAQKAISQWATMTAADTSGILSNPSHEFYNSDSSWNEGALNRTSNPTNLFDLGWGVYDFISHDVTGDSIYFLKLSNGTYKKLAIETLIGATYTYIFKYSDLDGSNEVSDTIAKANFVGKNFAYYSVQNGVSIDREPLNTDWDLTFAQYVVTTPFIYPVSGVLQNDSIFAAKAYPVDVNTVLASNYTLNSNINVIGYDWKSYDFTSNIWTISDSTVYFVKDRQNQIWKMIFTDFGGSQTGKYYFTKQLQIVGLNEMENVSTLGMYPNPANDNVRIMLTSKQSANGSISLVDLSGRIVKSESLEFFGSLQTVDIDLNGINPGLYQVVIQNGNEQKVEKLIIQ